MEPFNSKGESFNYEVKPFDYKEKPYDSKREPFNSKGKPFNFQNRTRLKKYILKTSKMCLQFWAKQIVQYSLIKQKT